MRILMMLTGGRKDPSSRLFGFDRVVTLYYLLHDAGAEVVVVSFLGGAPPIGGARNRSAHTITLLQRFQDDRQARDVFSDTLRFSQIYPDDFDAGICFGAVEDTVESDDTAAARNLIDALLTAGRPVAVIPSELFQPPPGSGDGLLIAGAQVRAPYIAATALFAAVDTAGGRPT